MTVTIDQLPDVHLVLADGARVALRDCIGAPLVVYFYPRADTSGCTREAQDFSALLEDFGRVDTTVIAVSRDTPAKLSRFAAKHDLTVTLASDEDGSVCKAFGVWSEKQLYGRTYMGIERATFLFDATGKRVRAWRKVKVPEHAAQVLAAALR